MAAAVEEEESAEAAADGEGDEAALKEMEEMVAELYRLRDTARRSEGGGEDGGGDEDEDDDDGGGGGGGDPKDGGGAKGTPTALEEEMERMVQRMEGIRVSPQALPRALYLRGRALLVTPLGSPRAEAILGRALKLEPGLSGAWTLLGETLWGRGDLDGARACFRGALQHGEDAEARRLLSMALRQSDGAAALRESLRHAEAAVRCQPCDGRNWYVLGNAYVSLFFAGGQRPEVARRALGAYGQAEKVDPTAASNPDLHLNRATLLQFEENYGAALDGYARAAALAPDWTEPRMRRARLLDYLSRICAAVGGASKARGRRRRALSPSLLGALGDTVTPMAALWDGDNAGRALLGRVLGCVLPEGGVPIAVGLSDGTGAVVLSVYNAAPGWGLAVGDAVAVGQPHVRRHHIQHQGKTFSFVGVRIPSPLALMVNGRRPPGSAVAAPRLSCSCAPESPSLER